VEKVSASVRLSACICILYASGNADILHMVIACESLGMEHTETTRSVWFVACAAYGEQNVAPQAVAKG